ncbi:MAG: hypothetical protein ACLS61_11315 [Ruminococcus sp.]
MDNGFSAAGMDNGFSAVEMDNEFSAEMDNDFHRGMKNKDFCISLMLSGLPSPLIVGFHLFLTGICAAAK